MNVLVASGDPVTASIVLLTNETCGVVVLCLEQSVLYLCALLAQCVAGL